MDWTKKDGREQFGRKQVGRKLGARCDCSYSREILLIIFRLVTLNEVSWSLKINGKIQTQSHSNLWYHSNMNLFFLFGNYFMFGNCYDCGNYNTIYSENCLLFICCVDISWETWFKNDYTAYVLVNIIEGK